MHRRTIPILLVCWILSACALIKTTPVPVVPAEPTTAEAVSLAPVESAEETIPFVEDILSQMTLDEKIGQMTQIEQYSLKPGVVEKYFLGSIISGGGAVPTTGDIPEWKKIFSPPSVPQTRLGIPVIYAVDAIHGIGALYGATIFPQPVGLGAANDAALMEQIGQATAAEMRAVSIPWNFAPIVAVPQDIRWGRTYEAYSEDPGRVTALSTAYLKGLQTLPQGYQAAEDQTLFTLATPKHFLGDGGTTYGTSTQYIFTQYLLDQGDMQYDESTVRDLFLTPYRAAIENGAMSIMVSFSSWNGVKMHAQKYWITDVLKGELGFEGFVVSDWGGIDQISEDYYDSVVTAINAGIDMNMVPYDYEKFIKAVQRAVMSDDIPIERIDDAVRRILTVKYRLGLFSSDQSTVSLDIVGSDEHRALARQAVRQSLVLLKNDGNVLPLKADVSSIYVTGKAADDIGMQCGGWSTEWQGESGDVQVGTTILEALQTAVSGSTEIIYNPAGTFEGTAEIGIAVIGEQPYAEGVGDASSLSLAQEDIQAITSLRAHSQNLIIILISGRPLVITDQYPVADAWVAAWLPGSEGGGVTDVLFGSFPFSGTLPYTWPRSNEQLPLNIHNAQQSTGCGAPLFPFGYGLGEGGSQPIEWIECP